MTRYLQTDAAVAVLLALALVVTGTVVGAGALVAGTQEATASHDSPGNYTVVLPDDSDHLPGDQNPEGASIQHFAALEGGFEDQPADRYEVLEWLVISSQEVDFSGCETEDTAGFGIDRDNDNEGTQYDDDLLKHRKDSAFLDTEIWVEFYTKEDFGGETIGITEQDAIVAIQNECYTMPEEPGWYQINGKINGTAPSGEFMESSLTSHYFPICDGCHDEDTAQERLGPRPGQEDTSDPTPTPTETATPDDSTPAETVDDSTPTPTEDADDTPTPDDPTPTDDGGDSDDGEGEDDTPTATEDGSGGDEDTGPGTPTPGEGPGFTGVAALLALVAAALLANRRR